jgi:N6-L-threonylcarbamoyladenine synthase
VNHIEAHLLAPLLEGAEFAYPLAGAVVSGGHSELFVVEGIGRYAIVGTTRDDAIGEAFDKVAKMLGLGFPGGPAIDKRSSSGDAARFDFRARCSTRATSTSRTRASRPRSSARSRATASRTRTA